MEFLATDAVRVALQELAGKHDLEISFMSSRSSEMDVTFRKKRTVEEKTEDAQLSAVP